MAKADMSYGLCEGCGEEDHLERKRVDNGDVYINAELCFECRNISVEELKEKINLQYKRSCK